MALADANPAAMAGFLFILTNKVIGVRYIAAITVVLVYIALCLVCWLKYRQRGRQPYQVGHGKENAILIAYASQTGTAERLAQQSADQLAQAGFASHLLPLHKIDENVLLNTRKALFVVSTYGEGEPPDNGAGFLRRYLSHDGDKSWAHLSFGVLALGDRDYRHFCGFGHALNHGLHHRGATSLFDMIEVDKNDESALRHWQYYLGQLTGKTHFTDWSQPSYESWRIQARECLNPDSPANPAFHIQLSPVHGGTVTGQWQAGDIAEIGPCNAPLHIGNFLHHLSLDGQTQVAGSTLMNALRRRQIPKESSRWDHYRGMAPERIVEQLPELPHREYSIASLPEDGSLDLLVRQVIIDEKRLGLGSGWLTAYAQPEDEILLRVRSNSRFHTPPDDRPMILIGNGTGLAGLRAHLRARAQAGYTRNWLVFGERTVVGDFFFADEILAWKKSGHLTHLDLAFSRDQPQRRYVQHVILERRDEVQHWIEQGAAIYVCGSLEGMAQGVDDALTAIFGLEMMEALADNGRYCRDVY